MSSFIHSKPSLRNMQDQILLTLGWCSVSWWGNLCVLQCFKWNGSHDTVYEFWPHCDTLITQDPTAKIIDTQLTLIFRMGQEACRYYFYLEWQPLPRLWMAATYHHLGYPICTAKNRWCSVDAHFQNGAVIVFCTFCQERLPVWWLWIAATTSPYNYCTYKTKNHWCSIDAHFNVPCNQDLLLSIIAIINVWTSWMPFSMIRFWLYGIAEPSIIPALVTLIRFNIIYLAT